MEEGQPGSPKGSNRKGNPAIGTLSWQGFQERNPAGYRKIVTSVMRDVFLVRHYHTHMEITHIWISAEIK